MLNLTFEVPAKLKSRREVTNCLNSAVVSEIHVPWQFLCEFLFF
ncbi:hypothetical protein Hdeb2414_s0014g00433631 [Helianthus debilis subsp. tardiflorus]